MSREATPGRGQPEGNDYADGDHKYLLSMQVLLDLCATEENVASQWMNNIPASKIRICALTVAQACAQVRSACATTNGERLWARLNALLSQLHADAGEPLAVTKQACDAWQSLIREPTLGSMAQVDRLFYAVAFSEGLSAVEYDHDFTNALAPLGIHVKRLGSRG